MYQLSSHFLEIKLRAVYLLLSLIFTLQTSYYYQIEILYIIGRPFLDLNHKFVLIDLTEAFSSILRICGIMSFLIIIPFFMYHFWSFYIPSRYFFERKIINKFSLFFIILLALELVFLYFLLFPKFCEFLLSFQVISSDSSLQTLQEPVNDFYPKLINGKSPVIMEITARLESYVNLSTRFYFLMLTLFQIPKGVLMFYYHNIIDYYFLCKRRKFFLFSSILISAFISPPDIISQSILAIGLFLFYEFGVFIGIFYSIMLKRYFVIC
jgi:sec-independent protein translocase protein TatC